LGKYDIDPNVITYISAILGILAGFMIYLGKIYESVLIIFLSQILDCTDGDLARLTGKKTRKGAFLDRIFDRFVDSAIIGGIVSLNPLKYWLTGFLALVGSLSVSISRAMAEAEGVICKVGIAGRDTRLLIIMLGLIFGFYNETLIIVAILSFITVTHRIIYTINKL